MCTLHKDLQIVVSTWNSDNDIMYKYNLKTNVFIKKQLPEIHSQINNKQNRYLQFSSTLTGLENIKTKYTIKVRSDEYYSDLRPIISSLHENSNKIVCNDIFFRKTKNFPYHPSDHLIASETDTLKKIFEKSIIDCENNLKLDLVPEQHYANNFIEIMENKVPSDIETTNMLMKKYFCVVPTENLCDYCVSQGEDYFINSQKYFKQDTDIKNIVDIG